MDISSLLGTMMSDEGVSGMSQTASVSDTETRSILTAALPILMSGALNQSNNSNTATGFANALTQHSANNTSNLSSFFGNVDTDDGSKIVDHLFGQNSDAIVAQIAGNSGVKKSDVKKVLASAAPLMMSLLGQEVHTQQQSNSSAGVSSIMNSLLGGGNNNAATTASTANLLAGLLGGGSSSNNSSSGLSTLLSLLK